jgi:hypothetical protein
MREYVILNTRTKKAHQMAHHSKIKFIYTMHGYIILITRIKQRTKWNTIIQIK